MSIKVDSARAWLICFSMTVIYTTLMGFVYSGGVLVAEFVDYFDSPRATVAWISSMQLALTQITGIVSGPLTTAFGYRALSFGGLLIAAISVSSAYFATSLWHLFLLISVASGIGGGIAYTPGFIALQFCFRRYLPLAFGIAMSGMGLGTMGMAPLLQLMISKYTWRGALLLSGGILLQGLCFAILLDAPSEKERTLDDKLYNQRKQCLQTQRDAESAKENNTDSYQQKDEVLSAINKDDTLNSPTLQNSISTSELQTEFVFKGGALEITTNETAITDIQENNEVVNAEIQESTNKQVQTDASCFSLLKKIIDIKVLEEKPYLLLFLICFFSEAVLIVPFLFIPDRAKFLSISPENGATLVTIMSGSELATRIFVGFLAQLLEGFPLVLMALFFLLSSIVSIASIWSYNYLTLALYSAFSGACNGGIVGLTGVVFPFLVRAELIPKAVSLFFLAIGIGKLYMGSLIGYSFDSTGSYTLPLILTATSGFLTFAFCLASHILRIKEKKAEKN